MAFLYEPDYLLIKPCSFIKPLALKSSHLDALVPEHGNDTAATGGATALAEQFVDAVAQTHSANIDTAPLGQMGVITRLR